MYDTRLANEAQGRSKTPACSEDLRQTRCELGFQVVADEDAAKLGAAPLGKGRNITG